MASLRHAGWRMVNATTFTRRQGQSPAAVAKMFKEDVTEEVRARAAQQVKDNHAVPDSEWREPWWELITKFMQGRASALQKAILLQVLGNTLATKDRLRSWGYEVDPLL